MRIWHTIGSVLPRNRIECSHLGYFQGSASRYSICICAFSKTRSCTPMSRAIAVTVQSNFRSVSPFTSGYICRLKNVQGGRAAAAAAMDDARTHGRLPPLPSRSPFRGYLADRREFDASSAKRQAGTAGSSTPEGRQGDKRGTTNCRYRAGAILHEHLSPREVSGCAFGRKVERRDLEDEARCLPGTLPPLSLSLSLSLSFSVSRAESSRGRQRESQA